MVAAKNRSEGSWIRLFAFGSSGIALAEAFNATRTVPAERTTDMASTICLPKASREWPECKSGSVGVRYGKFEERKHKGVCHEQISRRKDRSCHWREPWHRQGHRPTSRARRRFGRRALRTRSARSSKQRERNRVRGRFGLPHRHHFGDVTQC